MKNKQIAVIFTALIVGGIVFYAFFVYTLFDAINRVMPQKIVVAEKSEPKFDYFELGEKCLESRDYEGAIFNFDLAFANMEGANDGFLAVIYYKYALAECWLGNFASALTHLDKAINLNPVLSDAFYLRADVDRRLGNIAQFDSDLESAIRNDVWMSSFGKGRAKKRGISPDINNNVIYDKALTSYNEIINSFPTSDAYFNRGVIKYRLGDFYGSVADIKTAIEIDPWFIISGGLAIAHNNREEFLDDTENRFRLEK